LTRPIQQQKNTELYYHVSLATWQNVKRAFLEVVVLTQQKQTTNKKSNPGTNITNGSRVDVLQPKATITHPRFFFLHLP